MVTAPLIVVMLPLLLVSPSDGQPPSDAKTKALATMLEGNVLLERGRPEEALARFTEAYRLYPGPRLNYNIGQAESQIPGHEAQAYEAMSRFLTEVKNADPALRATAETKCELLRPKVGLVSVVADPPDADLFVDDKDVGKRATELPVVLGIGAHVLRIEKAGVTSNAETITIAGGETSTIQLQLPISPVPAAPIPLPPGSTAVPPAPILHLAQDVTPASSSTSGFWTPKRKLGAGLGGLALTSLVLGVVETFPWASKSSEFLDHCQSSSTALYTTAHCTALRGQFYSARNWSLAGYAGAVVLGGAGAYFFSVAPSKSNRSGNAVAVGIAVSASALPTVNVAGRF